MSLETYRLPSQALYQALRLHPLTMQMHHAPLLLLLLPLEIGRHYDEDRI